MLALAELGYNKWILALFVMLLRQSNNELDEQIVGTGQLSSQQTQFSDGRRRRSNYGP